MDIEKRTLEGRLVETVLNTFFADHLWDDSENIKDSIQTELNYTLKFITEVTNVENKLGSIIGAVIFKDRNGVVHNIDFNVTANANIE